MIQIPTPLIAIISPCYNEDRIISQTIQILSNYLKSLVDSNHIAEKSFCCLVDDGSDDNTWELMKQSCTKYSNLHSIKLTANVGHQKALMAGIDYVSDKVDCAITIDADLQDNIYMIENMITQYRMGNEIVYGVKASRHVDSFFKRKSAYLYYQTMRLIGVKLVYNHADFRLIGKKVISSLKRYEEYHLFLRGIIPSLGFKSSTVTYDISERIGGESKYNVKRMLSLAWDGITSFSVAPLRFIMITGFLIALMSTFLMIWIIGVKFFAGSMVVPGWASTLLPIYFLGGVQILSIGIIGEYLGRIYLEVKKRPRFIVEDIIEGKREDVEKKRKKPERKSADI